MASSRALRPQTFSAGPFRGVHESTGSRFDTFARFADAIVNGYIPDPESGSEVVCRPGTIAGPRMGSAGVRIAQGTVIHVATDGTVRSFAIVGGKVYRYNTGTSSFTDVSPLSGCTISTTAKVYLVQFGDQILVNDNTNQPWIMSDLGGTNVDAVEIEIDSSGSAWTAFGKPTVYEAKAVWIAKVIDGTSYRNAIVHSEEGDAAVGYQQTGYDNLWEITQNDTDALQAIVGTNSGLYYFRTDTIGLITGPLDQTTASTDLIAKGIGTTSPAAVTLIGDWIYFVDQSLRAHRLRIGDHDPKPLWMDMRRTLDALAAGGSQSFVESSVEQHTSAEFWPTLNVWVVAAGATATTSLWVFDTITGRFLGTWSLAGGVGVDHIGTVRDSLGRVRLLAIGRSSSDVSASDNGGYGFVFNWPGDETVYARDGDGTSIAWTAISFQVKTHPMGLKERMMYQWDAAVFEGEPQAATISVLTDSKYETSTLSPGGNTAVYQGAKRHPVGLAQSGPFCQVTVTLTTSTGTSGNIQPRLTSIEATGLPVPIMPEDY